REQHLLLVASRQGAGDLFDPSRDDPDLLCETFGEFRLVVPTDQAKHSAKLPKHRQGCICADWECQDETLLMSILRQEADAQAHGVARRARVREAAVNPDLAAIRFGDAEDHLGDFRSARSDKAEESENLTGAKLETDVFDEGRARQSSYAERGL